MHSPPTLFIAHRHELILSGLVAMAGDLGLRVAGIASDARGTVDGVCATRPGVALVDCLLVGDGFVAARRLADGPRMGYRYMKTNLNNAEDWAFEAALDAEALNMGLSTSATAMIWREKKKAENPDG